MAAKLRAEGDEAGLCCDHALPFHVQVWPVVVNRTSVPVAWSQAIAAPACAAGPLVAALVHVAPEAAATLAGVTVPTAAAPATMSTAAAASAWRRRPSVCNRDIVKPPFPPLLARWPIPAAVPMRAVASAAHRRTRRACRGSAARGDRAATRSPVPPGRS